MNQSEIYDIVECDKGKFRCFQFCNIKNTYVIIENKLFKKQYKHEKFTIEEIIEFEFADYLWEEELIEIYFEDSEFLISNEFETYKIFIENNLVRFEKIYPEKTYNSIEAFEIVVILCIEEILKLRNDIQIKSSNLIETIILFNNTSLAIYAFQNKHLYTLHNSKINIETLDIGFLEDSKNYDSVIWKNFIGGIIGIKVSNGEIKIYENKKEQNKSQLKIQIEKLEQKLSNQNFVLKANPLIVEKNRTILLDLKNKVNAL